MTLYETRTNHLDTKIFGTFSTWLKTMGKPRKNGWYNSRTNTKLVVRGIVMIKMEQIEKDIKGLPEEAQVLLLDFIQLLRKRYSYSQLYMKSVAEFPHQKAKQFREWAESHKNKQFPILSDKDISRESIYGERGL